MSTTLTHPMIPGFAGDVERFTAEQGLTETVFSLYAESFTRRGECVLSFTRMKKIPTGCRSFSSLKAGL